MVIVAHPDDVEFGCGGTIAKLVSAGTKVFFVICTQGNRGSRSHQLTEKFLVSSRKREQLQAAKILGAKQVIFLNHEDGNLIADINLKEQIVRLIRKFKPDAIFTHDPSWFFVVRDNVGFINHNDHRECGKAVLDAVYPLSRDLLSFPHHLEEGLSPHKVLALYLFNFDRPNFFVDVSQYIDQKIRSITAHKTQVDHPSAVESWVKERLSKLGKKSKPKYRYAEGFTRLIFQ